ncbi:MAG TPA: hypothetical protein VKZ60_07675 [Chloroflexota bacterium]|jgi:hypothetical protein|nr:hypothetical protein [Chloroflexota bacterium]
MPVVPGLDWALLATAGYALVLLAGAYGLGRWGERCRTRFWEASAQQEARRPDARCPVPWPHCEAAQFYWGMALLLAVSAVAVTAVVLIRRREPLDLLVTGLVLLLAGRTALWLVCALRAAE